MQHKESFHSYFYNDRAAKTTTVPEPKQYLNRHKDIVQKDHSDKEEMIVFCLVSTRATGH